MVTDLDIMRFMTTDYDKEPAKVKRWTNEETLVFFFLYKYTDLTVETIAKALGITKQQAYGKMQHLRDTPYAEDIKADAKALAKVAATRVNLDKVYTEMREAS